MKSTPAFYPIFFLSMLSILSSTEGYGIAPKIKEENVTYTADGITLKGFVAMMKILKGSDLLSLLCLNGGGLMNIQKAGQNNWLP